MASYEQYIIIGHAGKDAEMRYTPSGQAVTSFSVAVTDQYKNAQGETVKNTKWIRVSAWGNLAEVCNTYVKKGMLVQCVGKLKGDDKGNPRTYETQGGVSASFEMTASSVTFLSSKNEQQSAPASVNAPSEEDIPF